MANWKHKFTKRVSEGDVVSFDTNTLGNWAIKKIPSACLCFTANTNGSTVAMKVNGSPSRGQNFQYSLNGETWSLFTPGSTTITLSNAGDSVYFRGNNPQGVNENGSNYYNFVMTGSIAASGNIMSLIDGGSCEATSIPTEYCFCDLFIFCTSLTTPPALPATSLVNDCYNCLFYGCTNLSVAPELPATYAPNGCYSQMFWECSSLTTPPALPATTLDKYCYMSMFRNCTGLTSVPKLPATTLAKECYYFMFTGCSSLVVSDSSSGGCTVPWNIPATGNFTSTSTQPYMFLGCAGNRSSNDLAGVEGQSRTYYVANTPIG